MILTGVQIAQAIGKGMLAIDPFDFRNLEPNSYGFHLGMHGLQYRTNSLDCGSAPEQQHFDIPAEGMLLKPGSIYLCHTHESMGSRHFAATLYASRSVATLGIWIQVSAPLGHTGPAIPWTLEITVAQPAIVYPFMKIGKIAFWEPAGDIVAYSGKYTGSVDAVASRLSLEMPQVHPASDNSRHGS